MTPSCFWIWCLFHSYKKDKARKFCSCFSLSMWLLLFMRLLLFQIWLWWWRNCWPFMTISSRSPSLTPWVGMVGGTDVLYFSLLHSCMAPKQVSVCKGSDCFAQTSVHIFVSEVMDVSNVVNQASCGCKLFKQIIFVLLGTESVWIVAMTDRRILAIIDRKILAMIDRRRLAMIDRSTHMGMAQEYWLWLTGPPTREWLKNIGYDWQEHPR